MPFCYCGSNRLYSECCQPYHQGKKPPTPVALMRSRYSAFVIGLGDYLFDTHHPDYRGELTAQQLSEIDTNWVKLTIVFTAISADNQHGWVEFKAWYRQGESLSCLHERSQFIYENEQWLYTQGEMNPPAIARNEPCPCGRHKKFKQCCLKRPTR